MTDNTRAFVVSLLVLPLAACAGSQVGAASSSDFDPKVMGRVVARGPSREVQDVAFDECASGREKGFFGVDLVATKAATVLRVVRDPLDGPRVRVARPGTSAVLTAASCSVFGVHIENGRWVNSDGRVTLECRGADGTSYSANAVFSSCRSYSRSAAAIVDAVMDGSPPIAAAGRAPPAN